MNAIQWAALVAVPILLAFGAWWLANSYREDCAEVRVHEDPFSERPR